MDSTAFRSALAALGVTQVEASIVLGVDPRTVRRWACDEREVPVPVQRLLWACDRDRELLRLLLEAR